MPYSGPEDPDLPSNVEKLSASQRKKWVSTWNSVYSDCVEEGGSTDSCESEAFKIANGTIDQKLGKGEDMAKENIFTRIGREVARLFALEVSQEASVERSIGMRRLWDQLWTALDNSNSTADEWTWPVDIYVGDGGEVFAIVTQGGKLFQVPLDTSTDPLQLGEWVQVKEEFVPVSQSSMRVMRQRDGRHRWLFIAATTVLNRVAEIDAASLFDSFIEHAERTGDYPRLDFYHWGGLDPALWEFGTADCLMRDGTCYIASGLFDEEHPLAKATIRAIQNKPDRWGCSPEFVAMGEVQLISTEPEIQIPVYQEGINIRISVVLEKDAAGWFTGSGTVKEVMQSMEEAQVKKLQELFGDAEDLEGLEQFVQSVDGVNERVKQERLVHRAQASEAPEDPEEVSAEGEDGEEGDEVIQSELLSISQEGEFELDEESIQAIAQAVIRSPEFRELVSPLLGAAEAVNTLNQNSEQIFQTLQEMVDRLEVLERDEEEAQREWQQDLPASKKLKVTYRPRQRIEAEEDGLEAGDEFYDPDLDLVSSDDIANRTLSNIPAAY